MGLSSRIANKALRVRHQIYYKMEELYYHLDLNGEYCIEDSPQNVEFLEGSINDLDALIECDPTLFSGKKVKRFEKRLDAGKKLFLVIVGGKIGNYVWHSCEKAPLAVGIETPLNKDQLFVYDSHTFNEFRGKGVFRVAMFESVRLAKNDGFREVHTTHLKNNFVPQKVFGQIGYKLIKKYTLTRFFNKNFIKQKNVS